MNTSKLLIAALVGAVTSFIAGYLLYGVLFHSYMAENVGGMTEEPNLVWIFVGHLIYGILIAYIFMKWANISTIGGGAMAAFSIGLLFSLGVNAIAMGTSTLFSGIVPALLDSVTSAVVWMAGGAGVGWWLGRGKTSE